MNKEQEILAIGRLACELSRFGSIDKDLDQLLEKLQGLLVAIPGIQVLPQGAIFLYSPSGALLPVAQTGLPTRWCHGISTPITLPDHVEADDQAKLTSLPKDMQPAANAQAEEHPCCLLPLFNEHKLIGHTALFIEPDWQPDATELDFLTDLSRTLSILVAQRMLTETLRVREVELENARSEAIRRLGAASEFRDNETGMHLMRMANYAITIARHLGLPEHERELLAICAPMHDVGKIGIPDAILLKPGRLTDDEALIMRTHTEIGRRLLSGDDELLTTARQIASCHHERWDGSGYPAGLSGEDIPLLARICTVADVFDALTSTRPYKKRWSFHDAVTYIQNNSGTHFDPQVVAAFTTGIPEIARIRELYRDDIIDPKRLLQLPPRPAGKKEWIRWDESLTVGIDTIDEHHRYLFEITNELYEVVEEKRGIRHVARILKALDHYVQVHFRAEERMMVYYGYERSDQQHFQHRQFEERLRQFYDQLHENPMTAPLEVLSYLRNWLVRHIQVEDSRLRELVAA